MTSDHSPIVEAYKRDGVVQILQFFSDETVAEIRAELERYLRDDLSTKPVDARTLEADGKTIRNLWRLEQHNAFFNELARRSEMIELIEPLVNGDVVLAGVETFHKPARIGSAVPLHQDNSYFCRTPPDMLTVWVAIDPVTEANGPVTYYRGSHKLGMLPTRPSGVRGNSIGLADASSVETLEKFVATLSPGDATIHHCQTVHESASNKTDRSRLGLLFVYRGAHTKTDSQMKSAYTKAVTATPPA
ncbi:MAG: phytanoyl-CoA dioxygenase family protein [Planctomycetaceae bacterium]|nr:phytanoyl-CoA dioxygenase family protein [Planctomycetaceae bacterium]